MGLSGDPVPPRTGKGAAVSKKDHRFRLLAASLRPSNSKLFRMGVPMA